MSRTLSRRFTWAALLLLFAPLPYSAEVTQAAEAPAIADYYNYLGDYLKKRDVSRFRSLDAPETLTVGEPGEVNLTLNVPLDFMREPLAIAKEYGLRDFVVLVQPFIQTGGDAVTGNFGNRGKTPGGQIEATCCLTRSGR